MCAGFGLVPTKLLVSTPGGANDQSTCSGGGGWLRVFDKMLVSNKYPKRNQRIRRLPNT
ncbi:hypothetical protein HanRHA438_Chr03g0146801 [Helianthus annuus]|nr:hypothetical protein HanRHA438_Chr03g0146801 [Helianthus annuus]